MKFTVDLGVIEIICKPCEKCRKVQEKLEQAIRELESEYKTKYTYKIRQTTDLGKAQAYSANIALKPFIIIKENLAFAGRVYDLRAIKTTLLNIVRGAHLMGRRINYQAAIYKKRCDSEIS